MSLPKIGDTVTIRDTSGNQRKGKVIMFNLPHRWYMVEFKCEYRDYHSGKRSSYRECFKYNPESKELAFTEKAYVPPKNMPRGAYKFAKT